MGAVGQRGDAASMIMIADGADEDGDSARRRIGGSGTDLVHRQRLGAQLGHPDYRHDVKVTATMRLPAIRVRTRDAAAGPGGRSPQCR